jgi:hypothetical protein
MNYTTLFPLHLTLLIESKFKCKDLLKVDSLFTEGGYKIEPECQMLTRKIFQEILQIDGFAYWYGNTKFKDCAPNNYTSSGRAIVITQPDWLKSNLARFFTRKSIHDTETRVRIQTLFYKKIDFEVILSEHSRDVIASYLETHIDKELVSSKSICTEDSCTINIKFCDAKNQCDIVGLDPLPRPSGPYFTEKSAIKTDPKKLLWPDLEGKSKDQNIGVWINKNLFGCSGEVPYSTNLEKSNH